ncbi:MAG: hypothetical protein JNL06_03565 [Alphaproteobacteria bacterium]|nr:hypothetical protein [Alphaproteobacteria bacterium]
MTNVSTQKPAIGRFIIVAELHTKPSGPLESAMAGFGQPFRLGDRIWLLRAESTTIGALQNEFIQHLGPRDSIFIAEMGSGRTIALNWGPAIESRIRAWRV